MVYDLFVRLHSFCKLFTSSDLVHTTESLRNAKLSAGKTEKESRNLDSLLEPYKTENARLVRENNELHLGLLKLNEEKERTTRGKLSQQHITKFITFLVGMQRVTDFTINGALKRHG